MAKTLIFKIGGMSRMRKMAKGGKHGMKLCKGKSKKKMMKQDYKIEEVYECGDLKAMEEEFIMSKNESKYEKSIECEEDFLGEFEETKCAKDSKSSSKIVEGKGYLSVACYQDTKGFFSQLPSAFIHLAKISVPQSIIEIVSDPDDSVKVWITILSICILRKHFKDSQAEWTMISKKAETYLKQMKVKDFKQEIKNALSFV